jgi:HSP20 family protein
MTQVKFHPAPSPFRSLLDEFFNAPLGDFSPSPRFPAVNVAETDKGFRIELAVPGYEKADFHLAVDKNVLVVSAKKETEREEKTENYRRREFSAMAFERSFNLPDSLDTDQIQATYNNGVLQIDLNKKAPSMNKVKTISVG